MDSSPDIGTHSSFNNMKAYDSTYDTLTETSGAGGISKVGSDTQGTGISSPLQWGHTLVSGTNRLVVIAIGWENSGPCTVAGVTYGGQTCTEVIQSNTGGFGFLNGAAIYYIDEDTLPSDGANQVSVTFSAASTADFNGYCMEFTGVDLSGPDDWDETSEASPADATIENTGLSAEATDLCVSVVEAGNTGSFTHGQSQNERIDFSDASSQFAVTDLVATGSISQLYSTFSGILNRLCRMAAHWSPATVEYNLDLEVQFTNVIDFLATENLCIYMGTMGVEALNVSYWTGSSWSLLDSDLIASSWNNYTVSLSGADFTIRFETATLAGDSSADEYQVDAVLLQVSGVGSKEDPVDQQSDIDSSPDVGTHSAFAAQQYGPDLVNDTLTEVNVPGTYAYLEDYVDNSNTNIDNSANIGTANNFDAQKYTDNVYDTLTEADNDAGTSVMGDNSGFGTSYLPAINPSEMYGQIVTASSTGEVTSAVFYGRNDASFGFVNVKAVITDTSGNILANGVSSPTSVSTTAGTKTIYYSAGSRPIVTSGASYWLFFISDGTWRFYRDSSFGGSSRSDISNNYATPTNPTDAVSGTITGRLCYANVANLNYRLDIEEQFTSATYNSEYEYICVKTGLLSGDALQLEAWDGSWHVVSSSLVASSWNNISISTYLTSSTLYIRFTDGTQSGDTVQDSWQIDSVLLQTYNTTNFQLDLEVQWTSADFSQPNEYLCIYGGTMGAEDIKVDVWNGASWTNLFTDLSIGWNNISVSTYLTSSTFIIRFKGGSETGDTTQDSWNIDATLLHITNSNYKLDLEVQWTNVDYSETNEELCIYWGTMGSENLQVDVWTGASWQNVIANLNSGWNNVIVSAYFINVHYTIQGNLRNC